MSQPAVPSTLYEMVDICHRLADKGMVSATDGNISVRNREGTFYATRSSVHKGDITINDIVEVDHSGKLISGTGKPSTELKMHLFIYSKRPDVHAVVHAHPTFATAFAAAGQALEKPVFPEVLVMLGKVPLAPYGTPSTDELPESLRPFVQDHNAVLLANHGAVTYGQTLKQAFFAMEKLEHAAQITLYARMLGGERVLSGKQIKKLVAVSEESYGKHIPLHHIQQLLDITSHNDETQYTEKDVYEIVKRVVQQLEEK